MVQKKATTVSGSGSAKRPAGKDTADGPAGKAGGRSGRGSRKAVTEPVAKAPGKPAKEDSKTVATKKADTTVARKPGPAQKGKAGGERSAFLDSQRDALLAERAQYMSTAEALKAQADSLALEHEPGDVQFDEEGGEGGTANVDREIDLYLSAQARAAVVEIDRALHKIDDGTYGLCEKCGGTIPEARLEALPYAALCVTCKSGGLSSRR